MIQKPFFKRWTRLLLAVAMLSTFGCGAPEPVGTLKGTLTFDDKPVPEARLQFQSAESGKAATADTGKDGMFQLEKPLPAGKYNVSVAPIFEAPPAGETNTPQKPPERPDIPEKYRNPGTSGLTVDVEEGESTHDLKMMSK